MLNAITFMPFSPELAINVEPKFVISLYAAVMFDKLHDAPPLDE